MSVPQPTRRADIKPDTPTAICFNNTGTDPYREPPHEMADLGGILVCRSCGGMWKY